MFESKHLYGRKEYLVNIPERKGAQVSDLRIAVIGVGNIGKTLGRKWASAGHMVAFGVRNPTSEENQALSKESEGKLTIGTVAEALASTEVVVMALPGVAIEEIIATYAGQLNGRIIIDAANRMGASSMNSFASFQQHTPQARYFRAFNSLGWENFANPQFGEVQADLFYCGPEGDAQAVVEQLIADVGLRPIRLGDESQVGVVDSVATLWFALALGQKRGRHLAFKVLS
jgi:8-hydroxy-5-deazaflavin:NADPH oxidoreductase